MFVKLSVQVFEHRVVWEDIIRWRWGSQLALSGAEQPILVVGTVRRPGGVGRDDCLMLWGDIVGMSRVMRGLFVLLGDQGTHVGGRGGRQWALRMQYCSKLFVYSHNAVFD